MKKLKLEGKLNLNKETIAKLNDDQMSDLKGGGNILTDRSACNIRIECTKPTPHTLGFECQK